MMMSIARALCPALYGIGSSTSSFESLPLRSKGCKSSSYEIYALFYTQKLRLGVFFLNF